MRLLICAGGTGGGVYPALAVLQALRNEADRVLWVGSEDGMEADLVARTGVTFTSIPAAGVHGVGLAALPRNLLRLSQGYRAARRVVRQFRPEVMFFTGGYVAVPVALAGRRLPSVVYVPDVEPGLALRLLVRRATSIAVTTPDSRRYYPGGAPVTVTGYPTRPDLAAWERPAALETLGLEPGVPTLLVFGGSKGARSINRALLAALPGLLGEAQVVHISGTRDWPEVASHQASLAGPLRARYRPHPYLHEKMGAALRAADLVVSRAGAAVLGEYPLFGLPAILVPYPHAWRYQHVNARYLADQGAAMVIQDEALEATLVQSVLSLLRDPERRQAMSAAMQALAHPHAAENIARLLRGEAAGGGERGRTGW